MKLKKAADLFNLSLLVITIFISACNDDVTNSNNRIQYEYKAWDYSDNHYFLDTIYKQSFADFYNNITISSHTDSFAVDEQSFGVWVQTDVTTIGYRLAGLHIDLSELSINGKYHDSLKIVPNSQQGIRTFGSVRKLQRSEYVLNKYAGYVSLMTNLPENYFVGIAYKRTKTGQQFGIINTDSTVHPLDTLVLKMIKVQNLIPANTLAWEMKLRNIYQLPTSNVIRNGFEFYISYFNNGIYSPNIPNVNTPLISILGLDKYTNGRFGPPNGVFDFIPGITIDPENGWIIFPTLMPFLTNLQEYNLNGQTINTSYWYPEIYTELKSNARQVPNANIYTLSGYVAQ